MPVSEVEHPGELESFLFVYVYIKEKLAFQFADLVLGVGTALFPGPLGGHGWELVASCSRGVIATLSRAQGALIYIFLCGVRPAGRDLALLGSDTRVQTLEKRLPGARLGVGLGAHFGPSSSRFFRSVPVPPFFA